jgi:hypothetical protein
MQGCPPQNLRPGASWPRTVGPPEPRPYSAPGPSEDKNGTKRQGAAVAEAGLTVAQANQECAEQERKRVRAEDEVLVRQRAIPPGSARAPGPASRSRGWSCG